MNSLKTSGIFFAFVFFNLLAFSALSQQVVEAQDGLAGEQPAEQIVVTASAGLSSSYLDRGEDLGDGEPAFYGDIKSAWKGLYLSGWISSGDAALGTEIDLSMGYSISLGSMEIDIGAINYIYPRHKDDGNDATPIVETEAGELSEAYFSLSGSKLGLTYFNNIAGASGSSYVAVNFDLGSGFGVVLGNVFSSDSDSDYGHLDLSYSYNDNLTFTLSTRISEGANVERSHSDTIAVVTFNLPVDFLFNR